MRNYLSKNLPLVFVIIFWFMAHISFAQNEQKGFSFQGYARDFSGAAYSSSTVTALFSIYSEGESAEYTEQQSVETDAYGVFHAVIGSETPVDFAAIDFSAKKYFLKVDVKIAGGDFVEISNTELLAVPYAKSAETAVSAQTATSANNGNPAGVVLSFAGAPGKIPVGYLACDGSEVAVADYPELYAAIGDAWGGDGGTNFNLPDLRGQFLRGMDNGAGVDPDVAGRTDIAGTVVGDKVGSFQGNQIQSHAHAWLGSNGDRSPAHVDFSGDEFGAKNSWQSTQNTGGNETRPKNAYVLFIIKY